jgi:acetyl-CoA acyltransferase
MRRTFVAGGYVSRFIGKGHPDFIWKGHPLFSTRENPTLEDYIADVVAGLFGALSVDGAAVEKAWIGNFAGELFSAQGLLGAAVAGSHPGLLSRVGGRVIQAPLSSIFCMENVFVSRLEYTKRRMNNSTADG